MTTPSSTEPPDAGARDEPDRRDETDDSVHTFQYGHGRMPVFMKLVWLAFLAFGAWYVASWLLGALGSEIGSG